MSLNRRLLYSLTGLAVIALWLGACQPGQDTPQPDALPASLRVSAKIDSLIMPTEPIDISSVSKVGTGPAGALIHREEFNGYRTFTYDKKGRPTSALFVSNNAWTRAEVVRYEGDYVAEKFTMEFVDSSQSTTRLLNIKKYRYNANKQLKQVLFYGRNSNTASFVLVFSSLYEYDSNGQLRLIRDTSIDRGHHGLSYWENGDCVRQEYYIAPTASNPNPSIVQSIYAYDQQVDPLSNLPFDAGDASYWLPPSKHYKTRAIQYTSNSTGSFTRSNESEVENGYQLDANGHLISTRIRDLPNGIWSNWGLNAFTYAP